jgi:energy-coupling factor transporter ATPase
LSIIETKDLTYTYPIGTKPAFEEITLTINEGDFIILTGPSGCGKTTLCRCINGLIPHFYGGKLDGHIKVAGLEVKKQPIHKMAQKVGMVFQNPENQLFALTVEKDVAFGLENLGVSREIIRKKVDWALNVTRIYELKDRAPYELSGGQQQRVAIASVLAMQPDVIVLDEPTSFLDPVGAKQIFEVIDNLNKKLGITIILVEHRLDLTSKHANRVIIMNKGKIVLDGKPRDVFNNEKVRLVGIGIPKAIRLHQILKSKNIELNQIPLGAIEAKQLLKEMVVHD